MVKTLFFLFLLAGCGGSGGSGGNNTPNPPVDPLFITQMISVGEGFACAIAGGAAYCWGILSNVESHIPVQVQGLTSGVTSLSAGNVSACAIINGAAKCWGQNTFGELGNGSTVNSSTPV